MLVRSLFVSLLFLLTVRSDDDCPGAERTKLPSVRLRSHLLCGYDSSTRPKKNHRSQVSLTIQMLVKYFDFSMHDNTFTVDAWMAMSWMDELLTWNPDDYDSIKTIHMKDSEIWMPDLSVYNRRNQGGDPSAVDSATCIVTSTGHIACVPSVSHSTICTSDLSKFPFDTHNCTVRLGSWVHSGEELDLQVPSTAVDTTNVVPNGEWDLIDISTVRHPGIYKCCPNNTYPSINYGFKIQRKSGAHAATVILPAIALIVLTLASLWIAPNNPHRLYLCYVNLICEFLYAENTAWIVPTNGDNVPLILQFARDSLLLSAFTTIFSLLLKNMVESEKPAPAWASKLLCVLVGYKPGQRLLVGSSSIKGIPSEEDLAAIINSEDEDSRKKEWLLLAKIFDRVCFLIFLIVYLCMFIAFTP